jgi:hypothetical protein
LSRQLVFDSALEALKQEGFTIALADYDKRCVKGEKGLRANEWAMVSGVYLRQASDQKVKVVCIITQDITGGWREAYAENIANRIIRVATAKK